MYEDNFEECWLSESKLSMKTCSYTFRVECGGSSFSEMLIFSCPFTGCQILEGRNLICTECSQSHFLCLSVVNFYVTYQGVEISFK